MSALLSYPVFSPPQVQGLDSVTQDLVSEMIAQWARKMPRNIERMVYLDAKNKIKDLGVVIPPQLLDKLEVVSGWPEKAVFEMSNRIVWEDLNTASGEDFGLPELLRANRFRVEFPQAVASSVSQSVAFASATPGDAAAGEPDALMMFHSALWATGLWDSRRRALKAGLIITETDDLGRPSEFTVMIPRQSVVCVKGAGGWYVADVIDNPVNRVLMEPLPFRPTLDRPFGRARIDRTVMSLTDRAIRTGSRLEIHAEMFSMLKLILMGADESAFVDESGNKVPLWSWYAGRFNTLSKDEDGDLAELIQIKAESPEPHIAVDRHLASKFSGHTGVPMSSLGISTDNPESAQAKSMAREDIIGDAELQQTIYGEALHRTFENLVMLRDGLSEPPPEMANLSSKWRRPDRPTLVSLADAGSKAVAAIPSVGETEVGMEMVGMTADQIRRAKDELKRSRSASTLAALLGNQPEAPANDDAR